MAEHAHTCIVSVIYNMSVPKIIPLLYEEIKVSKSPLLRIKVAEYMYHILTLWYSQSDEPLGAFSSVIEEILLTLL